jgi:hypothetical protein
MMTSDPFADFASTLIEETDPSSCPLHLQMMTFFGRSGTGKTKRAAAFENHVYLDLEASATEERIKAWPWGKTWAKFKELIELTAKNVGGPLEGKMLVIDPISELWNLCLRHELAERKMSELPDDYGRTLTAIRSEFSRVMQLLLQLRMQQRMGTIFVAHEEAVEIVTPTQRLTVFQPKAGDKTVAAWVAEKAQMILRFSIEDFDPLTGMTWSDGVTPKWIIRTKPLNSADVVKDRTERLPPFLLNKQEKLVAAYGD